MKCFAVFALTVSCAFALVADNARLRPSGLQLQQSGCKSNSDCSPSQCCVDGFKWLIATRRDIINGRFASGTRPDGRCVNYIPEEGNCHYASFRSCGCITGTQCKYYPEKASTRGKRLVVHRPGTSKCEKPQ